MNEYYKCRSIYESNIVEFWKPITSDIVPNVIPNRYYISSKGNTYNSNTHKPIGLSTHKKGYKQFTMISKSDDGKSKQVTRKIHRCVLELFNPIENSDKLEAVHKNGNILDNDISNLEWCTSAENTDYTIKRGTKVIFGKQYNLNNSDMDLQYLNIDTFIG